MFFSIPWGNLEFYAFPPFICIGRVIEKLKADNATGILVVPDWPNQTWYNIYLEMVLNEIILLPRKGLLSLPSDVSVHHPLHKTLKLRAALVTGTGSCHRPHQTR